MKRKGISRKSDGAIIKLPDDIIGLIIAREGNKFAFASKSQLRRQKKNLAKADKQFDRILHNNQQKEKYYMEQSLAGQLAAAEQKIKLLTTENDNLKKEANDFADALVAKVEEIEKTKSFWNFFKYAKLVLELIEVIRQRITLLKTRAVKNT
jgi:uncharacterized membrane protein YgaE (UPF0421/DUF939 family)